MSRSFLRWHNDAFFYMVRVMKRRVILFQALFFCLSFPFYCGAVQPYTPIAADPVREPWRWRHETVLDDLNVLCMDEAKDGTLWFGNVGSIASYDGINLTVIPFDAELSAKITQYQGRPQTKILRVLADGGLLALIDHTLVLRTGNQWQVIIPDTGWSMVPPKLVEARDGTFWLMVAGALWRVERDFSTVTQVIAAPDDLRLESFCLDMSDNLWVVEKPAWQPVQLVRIPLLDGTLKQEQRQVFIPPVPSDRGEFNVLAQPDGTLILASSQYLVGLQRFDPATGRWETKEQKSSLWAHYSLLNGPDGSVWVGLQGELSRITPDNKLIEYPDLRFELPPVPLSLFAASNDRMWVIGRIGQVCSVDLGTNEWATYPGLSFEFETDAGVLWFRAKNVHQVVSYNSRTGEWLCYGADDGLIDRTYVMFQTSHGLIWAAGNHEGRAAFSVFDGTGWTRHTYPQFAELLLPNGAFEARDGTVWLGAQGMKLDGVPDAGGVLQFRVTKSGGVELVKHHAPPEFPYYVTAFAQTLDQTLWLGSTVICSVDRNGKVREFPELLGDNAVAMELDHEQSLWVAKENFGVCRWKDGVWEVFDKKDGIPDLKLSDLLVLQDGSVLVASSRGISRFDGTLWTSNIYPEWFAMSLRWSGLEKAPDGAIWFNFASGEKRMSTVFPETLGCCAIRHRPETAAPDVRITDYLQQVSQPGNTHIIWSAQDFWNNTPTKKLLYSWQLDGTGWSPFYPDTGRTFLSLKPGKHILEVRARDQYFNVDPVPDRIEFTVLPPVWKQAWFILLLSGLIGLIVLMIWILIRTRELHQQEQRTAREEFLQKQQEEREQNLIRQQKEKEKNLIERQKEREQNLLKRQQEHEELLLKQQQEREAHLREMDRIKMGFFTNISHELRTPMTVVAGRLQSIYHSDIDEKTKNSLAIVLRNVQRISTLITQLLDFRKIQEGKIKIEVTQGDLVPSLRDWVASLQVLAEQAQLSLSLDTVEECRGWFDFDKLQKICTNLIANSIKYTDPGGSVCVILREDLDAEGYRQLDFVVEDSGRGISQEHIPLIFDRFYRVSEASMAVGAGIGLNLTKELVELLGGQIRVESPIYPDTDRPGSRFCVRLPIDHDRVHGAAAEPPAPQESAVTAPVPSVSKDESGEALLILVVEDDEDIRNFIVEGLDDSYRVDVADNGVDGLRMAKERVPDLIITDVMMPLMDGLTLCRELKTSMETSHIPVVVVTAKTALESQIEGLKTGADDYIAKPFHMELLRIRVANLLESRKLLREQFRREYPVILPALPENTPEKEFLDKAMSVVREHYADEEFNPETLASLMHMGLRTLQRKLKAVTDHTPIAFINEYRVIQAAEMLKGTHCTIADVTFKVGFDDPSNFARLFKKRFEMSPSEYRAAHQA